ncbi:hypothetical protein [Polaromonas sp.]|uniref:hypothetical protein n=1 Tax=Polaromonas sp. TaxID=1869339 RepID=UPI00352A0259
MKWLARVRESEKQAAGDLTEPTEGAFVSFVSEPGAPVANFEGAGINDPEFSGENELPPLRPERSARARGGLVVLFHRRGVRNDDAVRLADDALQRARSFDDRRLCLECRRLSGTRCMVPHIAGAGSVVTPLLRLPQRCPGFEAAA